MKVEIFTVLKDAEYILPLYLEHYANNFPGCKINIYDNGSTDSSLELCKAAGCNIIPFLDFVPLVKEHYLTDHKNNVWKNSDADWVIVCDVDEIIQINHEDLVDLNEVDIVQFKGYNMMDVDDLKDPKLFTQGTPAGMYSKACLFRPNIEEINYTPGAHGFNPDPKYRVSKLKYKLLHYNRSWFNFENFCVCHSFHPKEVVWPFYEGALKKLVKLK